MFRIWMLSDYLAHRDRRFRFLFFCLRLKRCGMIGMEARRKEKTSNEKEKEEEKKSTIQNNERR